MLFLGEQRYFCPNADCGKNYKYKPTLTYHMTHECGVPPKYQCPICFKSYARYFTYKQHIVIVHKQIFDSKGCIY